MRPLMILALLGLMAACTPAQQCRIAATRELAELDKMISETQTDLARGYRLVARPDPFRVGVFTCIAPSPAFGFCDDDYVPDYRRERINPAAEQAKLASLRAQRVQAEARARRALAACPQE